MGKPAVKTTAPKKKSIKKQLSKATAKGRIDSNSGKKKSFIAKMNSKGRLAVPKKVGMSIFLILLIINCSKSIEKTLKLGPRKFFSIFIVDFQ